MHIRRHKISKVLKKVLDTKISRYSSIQKSPDSPQYKNLQIVLNTKVLKKVLNTKISKVLCIQGTKHQKSSLNTLYSPQYKSLQESPQCKNLQESPQYKNLKSPLYTRHKTSKVLSQYSI
jgi:hypothetical protein